MVYFSFDLLISLLKMLFQFIVPSLNFCLYVLVLSEFALKDFFYTTENRKMVTHIALKNTGLGIGLGIGHLVMGSGPNWYHTGKKAFYTPNVGKCYIEKGYIC